MYKKEFQDSSKVDYVVSKFINKIDSPNILELGVQLGSSTKKFLEICKEKKGKLFSVDIDDCSNLFLDENWKFIRERDDNFKSISEKIPKKLDLIYLDTIHTANHVEKILQYYYKFLNVNGLFIIDDVSWLPYVEKNKFNNFYCEINNKETYDLLLSLYNSNKENFEISFFFKDTGTAVIEKLNDNELIKKKKILTRELSIKNVIRKLFKKT
tara:strand:- start:629 stop:1264 length:636 start_codon:yes stop_codon:yes gene_type:complete